jgi:twist
MKLVDLENENLVEYRSYLAERGIYFVGNSNVAQAASDHIQKSKSYSINSVSRQSSHHQQQHQLQQHHQQHQQQEEIYEPHIYRSPTYSSAHVSQNPPMNIDPPYEQFDYQHQTHQQLEDELNSDQILTSNSQTRIQQNQPYSSSNDNNEVITFGNISNINLDSYQASPSYFNNPEDAPIIKRIPSHNSLSINTKQKPYSLSIGNQHEKSVILLKQSWIIFFFLIFS